MAGGRADAGLGSYENKLVRAAQGIGRQDRLRCGRRHTAEGPPHGTAGSLRDGVGNKMVGHESVGYKRRPSDISGDVTHSCTHMQGQHTLRQGEKEWV